MSTINWCCSIFVTIVVTLKCKCNKFENRNNIVNRVFPRAPEKLPKAQCGAFLASVMCNGEFGGVPPDPPSKVASQ